MGKNRPFSEPFGIAELNKVFLGSGAPGKLGAL
jgi:hypothetical protein